MTVCVRVSRLAFICLPHCHALGPLSDFVIALRLLLSWLVVFFLFTFSIWVFVVFPWCFNGHVAFFLRLADLLFLLTVASIKNKVGFGVRDF